MPIAGMFAQYRQDLVKEQLVFLGLCGAQVQGAPRNPELLSDGTFGQPG